MDRTAAEDAFSRLVRALVLAGGAGAVLAAGLAVWLARRAMAPMDEALALQRRFVSDASHELRTPLTLLSTRLQLLARRLNKGSQLTAQTQADLRGVLDDTAALTGILDDLLAAAEPGNREQRERCDLGELVARSVQAARAHARETGVALQLASHDPVMVEVSPVSVRRAVTALLDNALDHACSAVQVGVRRDGRPGRSVARVAVADDGAGLPPDGASRLFERFASDRAEQPAGGRRHYGLGLALVGEVAHAHGGSVSVEPGEHRGTCFVLTLPLAPEEATGGRLRRPRGPRTR
jgi:signal transduction histidine kinase